tara:strand:+ start:8784 stop:9071 length:288 start_codon:yes stop_codon:yes gene_type:complete
MIGKALNSCFSSVAEGFEAKKQEEEPGYVVSKSWIDLVVFVLILMAVAFFGKFLWNELLAGADKGKGFITVLKPLPNLWYAIAMFIALDVFFGAN